MICSHSSRPFSHGWRAVSSRSSSGRAHVPSISLAVTLRDSRRTSPAAAQYPRYTSTEEWSTSAKAGGMCPERSADSRSDCWILNWLLCATRGTAAQRSGLPSSEPGVARTSACSSAAAKLSRPATAARSGRVSPTGISLACDEDEVVADDQGDRPEPGGLEPGEERRGPDRVVGVTLVELVQVVAAQAVRAEERAARAQHPERLGEHPVLQGARRHVVQHREGD